jgi:hypothetical protein
VSVQFRVVVAKKDERTSGPADADVVVTVPLADASEPGFDSAVAYMRGALKASGDTGVIIDLLVDGTAATEIATLVATA